MDFGLTQDQEALRDAVSRVVAGFDEQYWLQHDRNAAFPTEFAAAIAGGGWLGIAMPPEYGGAGLGVTEAALMMRTKCLLMAWRCRRRTGSAGRARVSRTCSLKLLELLAPVGEPRRSLTAPDDRRVLKPLGGLLRHTRRRWTRLGEVRAGPSTAQDRIPNWRRLGSNGSKSISYWFGYVPGQKPVITNILDEVSDIPAHVSGDRNPIDAA